MTLSTACLKPEKKILIKPNILQISAKFIHCLAISFKENSQNSYDL